MNLNVTTPPSFGMQVCCTLVTTCPSLLLGIGPSSCAASSSWWQWQGCPPHPPWQPAPELCQWQSVFQSSQYQHYREIATTNYLLDLPYTHAPFSQRLNKPTHESTIILPVSCSELLTRPLLKVLLKDLRVIVMVLISFIEKLHEESLIKMSVPLWIACWPAVHQYGSPWGFHLGLHPTEVAEDWPSILWNAMVWPGSKVELGHLQWSPSTLVTLWGVETIQARLGHRKYPIR